MLRRANWFSFAGFGGFAKESGSPTPTKYSQEPVCSQRISILVAACQPGHGNDEWRVAGGWRWELATEFATGLAAVLASVLAKVKPSISNHQPLTTQKHA